MKRVVNNYSVMLVHLLTAQAVEFHSENVKMMDTHALNVSGLAIVYTNYKNGVNALVAEYDNRKKSEETEFMAGTDFKRDGTGQYYLTSVDYFSKFPLNEAEAAAIHPIKFVADTYRETVKKDYKSETIAIRKLVNDTRALATQLASFPSLTPLLDRLESENNEFEDIDLARTLTLEAKRKRGTLGDLVKNVNGLFDSLVQVITGLHLAQQLTGSEKEALLTIIDILNAQIHNYTVIYHRHAGINASRKKDNGDGDGDGGEGEDGDGNDGGDGEGGDGNDGDGTETPDIENPPPPPFIPDFE